MTKDVGLLTNTHTSRLPVLGADIPIAYFYIVAPVLLVGFYAYFHVQLFRLLECLTKLPAFFPDGRPLDRKAHPWLLIGLLRRHLPRLKDKQPAMTRLQIFVGVILAWWSGPTTLFFFWGRALTRHDMPLTVFHLVALAISVGLGLYTHRLALATLWGRDVEQVGLWFKILRAFLLQLRPWRSRALLPLRWCASAAVVVALLCLGCMSVSAIEGWPAREWYIREPGDSLIEKYVLFYRFGKKHQTLLSITLRRLIADFREQDVSTKTKDWWTGTKDVRGGSPLGDIIKHDTGTEGRDWRERVIASKGTVEMVKKKVDAMKELVHRANLRGRNLRNADACKAFLVWADLRNTDITGADFSETLLEGADLREAILERVNFAKARLEGADLEEAHLEKAFLLEAHLDGADLKRARMKGVNLGGAHLESAELLLAHLEGAYLYGVCLVGADLRQAHLEKANLEGANLEGAVLRETVFREASLGGANLGGANLAGAVLSEANLAGADLGEADLAKASLERANLWKARLEKANLSMADLRGARLEKANLSLAVLSEARLEGTNLIEAKLEGSDLNNTDLRRARLEEADLQGTHLKGASFEGAHLEGADLVGPHPPQTVAVGLTCDQLREVFLDEKTRIPCYVLKQCRTLINERIEATRKWHEEQKEKESSQAK